MKTYYTLIINFILKSWRKQSLLRTVNSVKTMLYNKDVLQGSVFFQFAELFILGAKKKKMLIGCFA